MSHYSLILDPSSFSVSLSELDVIRKNLLKKMQICDVSECLVSFENVQKSSLSSKSKRTSINLEMAHNIYSSKVKYGVRLCLD